MASGSGVPYAWLQEAWAGHGDTQVRSVGVDGGEWAQTADWALCFWASSSRRGLWMQLGGQLGECCSSGCGRLESQPISRKEVTHTHHTWAITADQGDPPTRRVTKVPDASLPDANTPTRLSYLPPPGSGQLKDKPVTGKWRWGWGVVGGWVGSASSMTWGLTPSGEQPSQQHRSWDLGGTGARPSGWTQLGMSSRACEKLTGHQSKMVLKSVVRAGSAAASRVASVALGSCRHSCAWAAR